jgi:RimJ/RimL family protein N-acetyltransferase
MFLDPSLGVHLTEIRRTDVDALVEYLNDRDIYDRTLRIPFPYTAADAEEWFRISDEMARIAGLEVNWAIRDTTGKLIGGIGLEGVIAGKSHRAEIGYWLAAPFRGRGIMTAVVWAVCLHGIDILALSKITALVFPGNVASARVLEKCGFEYEGYLKSHHQKDGRLIDAWAYGLVKK